MTINKKQALSVTLLGVMGSVPGTSPGAAMLGSNSSCMAVAGDALLFFDGGTGLIRADLSLEPYKEAKALHVFLTHYHYDHVMGLPFWEAMYQEKWHIHLYGPGLLDGDGTTIGPEEMLKALLRAPFLPMKVQDFRARLSYHTLEAGDEISLKGIQLRALRAGHPGGGLVYILKGGPKGPVIGYLTDTDLNQMDQGDLARLQGADLVYGDAHFSLEGYKKNPGWGHSALEHFLALQERFCIRVLALGHHAPGLSEAQLRERLALVHAPVEAFEGSPSVVLAREGDTWTYKWRDKLEEAKVLK